MRTAVLLSGGGSTFQALLDARVPETEFVVAISDRAEAFGLERATRADVEAVHLDPAQHDDRAGFGRALQLELTSRGVEMVLLAGFMRILDELARRLADSLDYLAVRDAISTPEGGTSQMRRTP